MDSLQSIKDLIKHTIETNPKPKTATLRCIQTLRWKGYKDSAYIIYVMRVEKAMRQLINSGEVIFENRKPLRLKQENHESI